MLNLFRSSTRHVPRLHTIVAPSKPVIRQHALHTTTPWRNDAQDEPVADSSSSSTDSPDLIDTLFDTGDALDEAAAAGDPTQATLNRVRLFSNSDFIQPFELGRKARTIAPQFPRKKMQLGPGRREAEEHDIFRQLNIDPIHEATNSSLLAHFVTDMGKIRGRAETNLTWRSQRKLGKAIRRARMMGIIPAFSRRLLGGSAVGGNPRSQRRN